MNIAAFDLGTTWAISTVMYTYHETLDGLRPQKLAGFASHLQGTILKGRTAVVFERPFARGLAATRMLWGMAGILEAASHTAGTAVLCITPGEIKKWATGRGDAKKPAMIAAAQRLGYDGENEHEADAWCLRKFAEATLETE